MADFDQTLDWTCAHCGAKHETEPETEPEGEFWDYVGAELTCPDCGKITYLHLDGDTDHGFYLTEGRW